jgi:hypothetical protein
MEVLILLLGPVMCSQIWFIIHGASGGDGVWILWSKLLTVKEPTNPSDGRRLVVDKVICLRTIAQRLPRVVGHVLGYGGDRRPA